MHQPSPPRSTPPSNVINLFTRETVSSDSILQITHLCPESSNTKMLYSNPRKPERLIAIPILCWGLRRDGEVVGLVPWLNEVSDCTRIDEQMEIDWEGYYREEENTIFFEPPELAIAQLSAIARCDQAGDDDATTDTDSNESPMICQELPDQVGTHALIVNDNEHSLTLTPVLSWALDVNGRVHGMLIDEEKIEQSPVIPGDSCLYSADTEADFRCFFQRDIAHQIREQNPETLAAIEQMLSM